MSCALLSRPPTPFSLKKESKSHFSSFAVCDGEDGCRRGHQNGRRLRRDGEGNDGKLNPINSCVHVVYVALLFSDFFIIPPPF